VGEIGGITWAKLAGGSERWLPPMHGKLAIDSALRFLRRRRQAAG
jgi:hypothetical protein